MSANDIVNELESVVDFLRAVYPDSTYYYQSIPEQPAEGDVGVRYQNSPDPRQETAISYVEQREWQVVFFGAKASENKRQLPLQFVRQMQKQAINKRMVIPIKATEGQEPLRYMRIGSFSFGPVQETEDGRDVVIGVMTTDIRTARDLESYEKIMAVSTTVQDNATN